MTLVEDVKLVVADPAKAPQAHGLLHDEAARLITTVQGPDYELGASFDDEALAKRVAGYEELSASLVKCAYLVGYFADPIDLRLIPGLLGRLANAVEPAGGRTLWLSLTRYPALLVLYGAGLALVAGRREELIAPILLPRVIRDDHRALDRVAEVLYPGAIFDQGIAKRLPELLKRRTPESDHLHEVMGPWISDLLPDPSDFDRVFDRFEFILGLVIYDLRRGEAERSWGPVGRFSWRSAYGEGPAEEIQSEIDMAPSSALVRGGLFGPEGSRLRKSFDGYVEHVARSGHGF